MTTLRSAMASPFSMRVASELISIGSSPKVPNCAQAPVVQNNKSAIVDSSRFMRGVEPIGALRSLPREKGAMRPASISITLRVFHMPRPGTFNDPVCLLYTSDAADDLLCVDLGGRR